MQTFLEFTDKQGRESKKHLTLIKKVLESKKIDVKSHLGDNDPYLYVKNTEDTHLSFDGVRIYTAGNHVAYRVQRREDTHPYGKSYLLDIEEIFKDLTSEEDMTQEKAGGEVVETVIKEITEFFRKSAEAENDLKKSQFDMGGDPFGKAIISTTGSGYSNLVGSKGTNNGGAAG